MKRACSCGVLLLLCVLAGGAEPPRSRVVRDTWDVAYVAGAKFGYVHTVVEEAEREGRKTFRTTMTLHLTIRRYDSVVNYRMESTADETADGKVTALSLTEFLDKGAPRVQKAEVRGDKLALFAGQGAEPTLLPWDNAATGPEAQERLLSEKKVKPGDQLEYLNYELPLLRAVPVRVTVGDWEEVDVLKAPLDPRGKAEHAREKLLRVEAAAAKVVVQGTPVQLPKLVTWRDREMRVLRSETELPGLGTVTFYRTTEAVAKQEGAAPALLPDLGLQTMIALNRPVERIEERKAVTYRITVKGDADPASTFARDDRQEARNVKGDTFELRVAGAGPSSSEKAVKDEYLKPNYFITSDDPEVKQLAAAAAGVELDPWKKALRIEKWVHERMTPTTDVGFVTAAQVARDRKGDCRQHALLTAAMCRAAGVPARTAVGVVYVDDPRRGPVLVFHMWTEVHVDGHWVGLDAVFGRGGVGPGHLKINDHSWQDTQTLAPLLPVTRVLGKLKVEVVGVE